MAMHCLLVPREGSRPAKEILPGPALGGWTLGPSIPVQHPHVLSNAQNRSQGLCYLEELCKLHSGITQKTSQSTVPVRMLGTSYLLPIFSSPVWDTGHPGMKVIDFSMNWARWKIRISFSDILTNWRNASRLACWVCGQRPTTPMCHRALRNCIFLGVRWHVPASWWILLGSPVCCLVK